ncbi:MAG: LysR family transcriptional regulator [Bacteriovoracaceae bacterium]|nr:LysR family transcriptional regulator [Bacteriovoracaceae bacterium]
MNLHHLKYFLVIAEEGSLSAASKKLLVGQPALSAQLKNFEEWLGVELFKRTGKRLHITPSGEFVLKYARAIKNLEDELLVNLQHSDEMGKKELILGAQESVPKTIIAQAISKIKNIRSVRLKVFEGTGEELFASLNQGRIDFFIGNFKPLNQGKEMYYLPLAKENVSVWGAKKFHALKKGFPKSLDGKPFILPGLQNPVRHDFEKVMMQKGIGFDVSVEAQDTALQKELAARGEGLLLMGEDSVSAWVCSGRLFKIGDFPEIHEHYWLGMVKRTIDNDYMKSIIHAF